MPVVAPKLPSIWNGGWASNRLGYVPPRRSGALAGLPVLGSMRRLRGLGQVAFGLGEQVRQQQVGVIAVGSAAHRFSFHASDQPVAASPRPSSDFFAAAKSFGSRRQ